MWHPTNEVWLPVQKYPEYEVSNLGRIRKKNKWHGRNKRIPEYRYCKGSATAGGYRYVRVCRNTNLYIAHAVLEAFVGPRPPGLECDHINRNTRDNCLVNLRWVTHSENMLNRKAFSVKWRVAQKNRNQPRNKKGQFI